MKLRWRQRLVAWIDATTSWLGFAFITAWERLQKAWRRPAAQLALKLGFAFYPLLALAALGWLAWDYSHARNLAGAENAVFDQLIRWRPLQPKPSGKVVIVDIDACSINYFRALGEGGWPWPRSRHADLLDALDRAGVRAVGYDVLFSDPSNDPASDAVLEAMAAGGNGRFVFAAARLDPVYDADSKLHIADAPSAFPLVAHPQRNPTVALLLPYGKAMRANAALVNVARASDGILRDVPLRIKVGDWALPSLALRLVTGPHPQRMAAYPARIRINWRTDSPLPEISAANLITGQHICGDPKQPAPPLKGRTALVGYTAAGLNDAKPTPVNFAMAGVAVHAEAVEALLNHSAIWMPPAAFKYLLAALLVLLTGYSYFRGEPSWDLDDVFVAGNLLLLLVALVAISLFSVFLDIFAALGFGALFFGVCRGYAKTQRGYAIGNDDYREPFDAQRYPWLALARLRFVPDRGLDEAQMARRVREFRRRLRRFMYRGTEAVALDCVVEYDTWLWDSLTDVTVFLWGGASRDAAVANASRELAALHAYLVSEDAVLPDDGSVRVACIVQHIDDPDEYAHNANARVAEAIGSALADACEQALTTRNRFTVVASGADAADRPPRPHPA